MNTFYLDVCVHCSTDQFVGSRSYYRSSQDQTLARETSNINRCSMLTQIIVVAQENAFCSDTQSLPTSPLGGVCRLDMNNSWHDHHRPHICACRAQGYYPLPANLGSIIHWLPTSPGGIWAAWCRGWPSWIWWWWFQTGGIWAEAEVQQHQATKRRWEGGRRPFSTKMSHRFDNHTRVYGL